MTIPGSVVHTRRWRLPPLPPRRRRLILAAAALVAVVAAAGSGLLVGVILGLVRHLPDISPIYTPPGEATRVYARNGELIASLYRENRVVLPLGEIPLTLRRAVIAIEDERFYSHPGVDIRGTVRAVWRNLLAREIVEGGSTITQQLARSLFLTRRRALSRKLAEMVLAVEIERRLTKDEILERYLNEVYFGHGAYGVQMAARIYFGKPAGDLTLAESAFLAGLIRAPSAYDPFRDPVPARRRQSLVLQRMAALGYITRQQAAAAAAERLRLQPEGNAGLVGVRAPYFISYILPQLLERYGEETVYTGGLRVYTTLDPALQAEAERAVRRGIEAARTAQLNVTQGALVALDPQTGHILAMIGGYDFAHSQFNRAWQARRQPGSAFKPFVYLAALMQGMPPTTIIVDEPIEYDTPQGIWKPKNYTEEFAGPVRMRQALERSINIPAIRTLEQVGPVRVARLAQKMGIRSPLRPDLSLALGSSEVTPLELTSAYGVLAALGVRAEPLAILRVEDRLGRVLEEHAPRRELVVPPEYAYVMTDILKGVILRGTGRGAALGRPLAGKTGTTDDYRNAWFIGYTPYLVTSVWVGNDDNSPMVKVVGATVPARIWRAFMQAAVGRYPPDDWPEPPGVVTVTVCGTSGLRATSSCDDPRREAFIRGTEPTDYMTAQPSETRLARQWTRQQAAAPPPPPSPPPAEEVSPAPPEASAATPAPSPPPQSPGTGAAPAVRPRLVLLAPRDREVVRSPFTIEGRTEPGAVVYVTVQYASGATPVSVADMVRAGDDGRFSYTFGPADVVPGVRYIVTITVVFADGQQMSGSFTVVEASGPAGDGLR
ncbi:MAG: PBP1A family penicillin-binding protein [Armatimonadota bacterium]|nr:PBP1A family penicillin-binding protein [Armatimonadota bacterium]MDR7559948.1 PBP1A family penicillin-binding protein [Armatimonadota bacterium]MDR7587696.1 PBP1A family penicillin-binding protein [Armatimonadota bacterium]MDR7611475.1 PBP1A family penicillin-binding protein [Armatimonadota bacterium]